MCLVLKDIPFDETKSQKVYKVLLRNKFGLVSPYRPKMWEIGKVKSDRESTALTKTEEWRCEIFKGLHFFVNIEDAYFEVKENIVIVECEVKPEDFIGKGQYPGSEELGIPDADSVVYTQCEFVRVVEEIK